MNGTVISFLENTNADFYNLMLGRFDNFMVTLYDIPKSIRGRIHIKSFNTGWKAENTEPQRHGDFENLRFFEKNAFFGEEGIKSKMADVCNIGLGVFAQKTSLIVFAVFKGYHQSHLFILFLTSLSPK